MSDPKKSITAKDLNREIFEIFDEYVHSPMSRRDFLNRVAKVAPAGLDTRINGGWPAYEAALVEHDKTYTAHVYDGMNHGFHNDTTPRYDESSAVLAWERTIEFFDTHLRIQEDIPEAPTGRVRGG